MARKKPDVWGCEHPIPIEVAPMGKGEGAMRKEGRGVVPEQAIAGPRVRVLECHRIAEWRGTVVGRYGGVDQVAEDVRFADGRGRLFWPWHLKEVEPTRLPWWLSLSKKAGVS